MMKIIQWIIKLFEDMYNEPISYKDFLSKKNKYLK